MMSEIKIVHHAKNFGRCPVGLMLVEEADIYVCHAFTAMTSFGPTTFANRKKISDRAKQGIKRLIESQDWLSEHFYMKKMVEGGGKQTNVWHVFDDPRDHPDYREPHPELNLGPDIEGAPPEPGIPDAPEAGSVGRGLPDSRPSILYTEDTRESLAHNVAIDLFKRGWESTHPGRQYHFTGQDMASVKQFRKAGGATAAEFTKRLPVYFNRREAFVAGNGHSLAIFVRQFNSWEASNSTKESGKFVGSSKTDVFKRLQGNGDNP